MNRQPEDIRRAIDTVLSGASHDPTLFHRVVNASKGDSPPVKRKLTLSMAIVLILALLTGTAAVAAAAYQGVTWFLTERSPYYPLTKVDSNLLMTALTQASTSEWLDVSVQDAYWDGSTLSISLRATTRDASTPFALLYDIGMDGESFDTIWMPDAELNANRMPVEEWLAGRTAILLQDPDISFRSGSDAARSWHCAIDYIHVLEENAVIMMLQIPVNDLSEGASATISLNSVKLHPGDPEHKAESRLHYRTPDETEFAELVVEIPAMNDPYPEHVCEYTPATCVSPQICTICGRYEGWLGEHDFQPGPGENEETCTVCTYVRKNP